MSWRQGGCCLPYCNKLVHSGDFCNNHLCHDFVRFLEKIMCKTVLDTLLFTQLFRQVCTFKMKTSRLLHGLSDWWQTAIIRNTTKQAVLVSEDSCTNLATFCRRTQTWSVLRHEEQTCSRCNLDKRIASGYTVSSAHFRHSVSLFWKAKG